MLDMYKKCMLTGSCMTELQSCLDKSITQAYMIEFDKDTPMMPEIYLNLSQYYQQAKHVIFEFSLCSKQITQQQRYNILGDTSCVAAGS